MVVIAIITLVPDLFLFLFLLLPSCNPLIYYPSVMRALPHLGSLLSLALEVLANDALLCRVYSLSRPLRLLELVVDFLIISQFRGLISSGYVSLSNSRMFVATAILVRRLLRLHVLANMF